MSTAVRAARQGHRLLQVGMSLFLLGLMVGIAVPFFAVPRLGLSTHLLGIMQGLYLMAAGLLWPRLRLPPAAAGTAFYLVIYGCLAAWSMNLLGAIAGAGQTMLPIAAGGARGSNLQEVAIMIGLRSGGVALIASAVLIWIGLFRSTPPAPSAARAPA
jgi:(hydroxyamino)benzene mutase